jgi:ABC-type branched-subunit amino acid transport system substrate-binding protein
MHDGSLPGGLRRAWRLLAVCAAVMASAAAIAACGSDDDDGGGGGAAAGAGTAATSTPAASGSTAAPKGEPIRTMTIAAVNWNGPAYPNILETAKLYEKWVNAHGGIAGRPLEVTVCDEMGDPNQLATCGRRAIAEKVVAVVGSFTLTGDRVVPILENGETSWFGICCAVSPAEANSPITFNFGPGTGATVAYSAKAADLGCKTPALVVLDVPTKNLTITTVTRVLAARGIKLAKTVTIPLASQDYAPQVAQATAGGTDCVLGSLAENQWASFLPAFQQSGSKAKLIGSQGNFDEKVAKDFPQATQGGIVVGYYPDISSPAFQDYRDAIAQYKPPSDLDYNSLGGLGTWTGYTAFKTIVEGMSGPVNNRTFLAAARKTTKLETGGKLPTLDLTTPWPGAPYGYTRVFNTAVTYSVFDNAKLQVEQEGFFDMKEGMRLIESK